MIIRTLAPSVSKYLGASSSGSSGCTPSSSSICVDRNRTVRQRRPQQNQTIMQGRDMLLSFSLYINRSQKSVVANRLTSSHAGTSSSKAIASFSASSRRADSEKNLHGLINTENASLIIKSQNAIYYTKRRSAWCIVRETEVASRLWCQNWRWTSSNFPLPRICFLRSTSLNMSPWNWHGKFTLSVAKNIRALCSESLSRDEWSNNRRKLIECICMAAPSFFLSQKGIKITPKAIGNRKRDCGWGSSTVAQSLTCILFPIAFDMNCYTVDSISYVRNFEQLPTQARLR